MTSTRHKPHPLENPYAPAFPAGAGGFRPARVHGLHHPHESKHVPADAPAAKRMVWGRDEKTIRRTAKDRQPPPKSRLEYLSEGASRLAEVHFGHAITRNDERFDNDWWGKAPFSDPNNPQNDDWVAVLRENRSPADAVLHIFDNWKVWSFDCAEFVQVVLLYAVVKRLGKEQFDKRVATNTLTKGKMLLRASDSPGLTVKENWQHEIKELAKVSGERAAMLIKEQERRFKSAPNGSRVVFANRDPRAQESPWQHENTIKMGEDQFIAHGPMPGNPFVTREQIYARMAHAIPHGGTSPLEDHIYMKNFYISTIQVFVDPDG